MTQWPSTVPILHPRILSLREARALPPPPGLRPAPRARLAGRVPSVLWADGTGAPVSRRLRALEDVVRVFDGAVREAVSVRAKDEIRGLHEFFRGDPLPDFVLSQPRP